MKNNNILFSFRFTTTYFEETEINSAKTEKLIKINIYIKLLYNSRDIRQITGIVEDGGSSRKVLGIKISSESSRYDTPEERADV